MATKEQLKTWIVDNQDKQGKEGKDGQDFEKVKAKYISLRGKTSRAEADAEADVKTGDYSVGAERARTVAQGVTLGFADEIEAGARSLFSDSKYKDIRDEIRQNTRDFRTDNPGQALALEMAGGVVIPGGILRSGAKALVGKGLSNKRFFNNTPRPSTDKLNKRNLTDPVSNSANTYKKAVGNNAALGATYGAGASESESASGIAADAALGGAVGGVAGGAILGATRQLKPLVTRDAKRLAEKAIARDKEGFFPGFITRGQSAVSAVERASEGQLSNVSKTIKKGRAEGLEGYNMNVFDDVFDLVKLGNNKKEAYRVRLGSAENNTERARVIREMVNENYDSSYMNMRFYKNDNSLKNDLADWYKQARKGKSENAIKEIDSQFQGITSAMNVIPSQVGKSSANGLKDLFQRLRSRHDNVLKKSLTGDDVAADLKKGPFGSVYKDLEDVVKKNIRKNSKNAIDDYDATQYAYNAVLSLEDAVSKSVGKGLFTPTQVHTAFSRSGRNANAKRSNKAMAKGIGNIAYKANTKFKDVVGDTIPDSGTSGSIISTGSLLGLGGLVGSGAVLNPAILGVIGVVGAKALQYHPALIKRFNKMIAKGDYRQSADLLERYAATSGAAGVEVNQLINELRQGR